MRKLLAGIVVCLTLFGSPAAVRAQVSGQIQGTVVDEEGKGLEGVEIEASAASVGSRTGKTGKEGRFRFVALRPGVYKVTFTLAGHADVQKNATVRLDGAATVNAKMFRVPV